MAIVHVPSCSLHCCLACGNDLGFVSKCSVIHGNLEDSSNLWVMAVRAGETRAEWGKRGARLVCGILPTRLCSSSG